MNEFLLRLFGRGGYSTLRWVYVWTYLFVVVVVFGAWAFMYCKTDAQADIPLGVAGLAGTIIAVVTGNKYLEKREEVRTNAVVPKPKEPAPGSTDGSDGADVASAGGAKG